VTRIGIPLPWVIKLGWSLVTIGSVPIPAVERLHDDVLLPLEVQGEQGKIRVIAEERIFAVQFQRRRVAFIGHQQLAVARFQGETPAGGSRVGANVLRSIRHEVGRLDGRRGRQRLIVELVAQRWAGFALLCGS
jgi:hypothetical protein